MAADGRHGRAPAPVGWGAGGIVAVDTAAAIELIHGVEHLIGHLDVTMVTIRCQTAYSDLFTQLVAGGYRVHWTDLRLTLNGKPEQTRTGVMLSNWEI